MEVGSAVHILAELTIGLGEVVHDYRACSRGCKMLVPSHVETWVLLTNAVGDNNQCLALADAIGRPFLLKRLDWPAEDLAQDRRLTAELLAENGQAEQLRQKLGLEGPWPRLVICCGRRSGRIAFWIKRLSGGYSKIVSIGRARRPLTEYDLLIASPHFLVPEHPKVIHLALPMARCRNPSGIMGHAPANLTAVPKPWFTILLGGEVKQFSVSEPALVDTAFRAQMAADRYGGSVVLSTSRRTPNSLLETVESVLDRPYTYRWSPTAKNNPYDILLKESAALFVTADSMSMILDGCASGAPTYVIEFPERLDLRRRWRRTAYRLIQGTVAILGDWGLEHATGAINRMHDWLHGRHILRYPRDLRRLHASAYSMGLAQPAAAFDPSVLPARKTVEELTENSGMDKAVDRCLALLGHTRSPSESEKHYGHVLPSQRCIKRAAE